MIVCQYCGMEMRWITHTHLRTHGLTLAEYREAFGETCPKSLKAQFVHYGLANGTFTHGLSHTRAYRAWRNMQSRCTDPMNPGYPSHGAQGIKVCESWQRFEQFFTDMGECPPGLSIERSDNSKDYEPSNCRWATRLDQTLNRSVTIWLTYKGETMCAKDWERRIKVIPHSRFMHLVHSISIEEIIETYAPDLAA